MDKIPGGKKKLSKNIYRDQVVSKLKGISRAILDMSIPFAVDVAVEKVCKKIQEKLHTFYKNTTINSLITLALNIIGLLLVLFYPFGKTPSNIFAILIFFASGIFSLSRCVKFVKKYMEREEHFKGNRNLCFFRVSSYINDFCRNWFCSKLL